MMDQHQVYECIDCGHRWYYEETTTHICSICASDKASKYYVSEDMVNGWIEKARLKMKMHTMECNDCGRREASNVKFTQCLNNRCRSTDCEFGIVETFEDRRDFIDGEMRWAKSAPAMADTRECKGCGMRFWRDKKGVDSDCPMPCPCVCPDDDMSEAGVMPVEDAKAWSMAAVHIPAVPAADDAPRPSGVLAVGWPFGETLALGVECKYCGQRGFCKRVSFPKQFTPKMAGCVCKHPHIYFHGTMDMHEAALWLETVPLVALACDVPDPPTPVPGDMGLLWNLPIIDIVEAWGLDYYLGTAVRNIKEGNIKSAIMHLERHLKEV